MKVRDVFLCACYTGLSYVDIKKLNKTHIKKGDDNFMWIYINRDKTNIPCNIPLLPKAESLINKYIELCNSDVIFPVISNQKTNKYLKQIASICGIDKNITFHSARHTFATTITLCNGMPIETVSKMLGHNSLKTTQIYARVIDSKVSSDMQVLRQKFM
jgi:site-specific recombinase XerD